MTSTVGAELHATPMSNQPNTIPSFDQRLKRVRSNLDGPEAGLQIEHAPELLHLFGFAEGYPN